jgi:peroxiredoxin Q/BCP
MIHDWEDSMKRRGFWLLALWLFLGWSGSQAADEPQIKVGDNAKEFTLPAATKDTLIFPGIHIPIVDLKKNIILAFYPADWSGGCTSEMCTMRDNFTDLSTLGTNVYGISGDYVFSHREWARHLSLPFVLLSDHDHTVAKAYNSFNEKTGMNFRTVYIIDTKGRIAYIDLHYSTATPDSFEKLKAALATLK